MACAARALIVRMLPWRGRMTLSTSAPLTSAPPPPERIVIT